MDLSIHSKCVSDFEEEMKTARTALRLLAEDTDAKEETPSESLPPAVSNQKILKGALGAMMDNEEIMSKLKPRFAEGEGIDLPTRPDDFSL